MEKYELRKGEIFIEEYVDNDGKPVIIFEDEKGNILHGWVFDLDDETARLINTAAVQLGMDPEAYVEMVMTEAMERMIEEGEKRKAIEEISD